jgi:NAD(P)-dependent dehydrogenase (short-subunit alcohol dehydrogenase family)
MGGRLAGRRVLVVGGGSGIGRAAVLAYLTEGADVTVLERSDAARRALERAAGSAALQVVAGDGTAYPDLDGAVRAASGDGGLDHLTCCVGAFDHYARIEDLDPGELEAAASEVWRRNVLSVLLAVRAATASLRRARGSITLTLSESAFHPVGGGVLYGSSKWALRGVLQHLAATLAPDVRVNAVAPGGTSGTGFSGLQALGTADRRVAQSDDRDARIAAGTLLQLTPTPDSHVGAYMYLADSAASGVVTGQVINTDGGRAVG